MSVLFNDAGHQLTSISLPDQGEEFIPPGVASSHSL